MAGKKDNIKALFSNTRTRIILLFTVFLVITTIIIGYVKLNKTYDITGATDVSRTPASISSIPGALNQTDQYAALQQQQNVEQAKSAEDKGKSSIPTIIRSQAFGQGVESVGAVGGQGSVGFATLARENSSGPQSSLWFQNLKDANCSKDSIQQAVNENNPPISDLALACSCEKLKAAGYELADLKDVCNCRDLRTIGVSAKEFKQAGYTADALKKCGFTACEERGSGFSAEQMKDAGYSDGELKGSGFSDQDIAKAGGIPNGISLGDITKAGCDAEGLKSLRSAGVSAAAIRRNNGCSSTQIKEAGFNVDNLKNAGFSAAELKSAGFSPEDLKNAGYNARDLLNAGISPEDLKAAGFIDDELKSAEAELPPGIVNDDVKSAGCSPEALKRERLAGVSAAIIIKNAKCNANQLKAGGFTDGDLLRSGLTASELKEAESVPPVKDSPVDDATIKSAGCEVAKLLELQKKGFSAKKIHDLNGCSAIALKASGFDAANIADAGFNPADLTTAGFSSDDLKKAGVALTPAGIIAALRTGDCSVKSLEVAKNTGISVSTIRETLGCSAESLKDSGYSVADLKNAGFSAGELKNSGFLPEELKAAGYSAKELRAAGFSADSLKKAGFSADALTDAGFSAEDLKNVGFSADALKKAGFSPSDLKTAGYSADELHKAGYSAKDLKEAGYGVAALKNAGFKDSDLKEAGVSSTDEALAGLEKIDPLPKNASDLSVVPSLGDNSQQKQDIAKADNAKKLQDIMDQQRKVQIDQKYQQKIKMQSSLMLSSATQIVQGWKTVAAQKYLAGTKVNDEKASDNSMNTIANSKGGSESDLSSASKVNVPVVRMGDILFAVIDTSVNTDEPGPILATIVSGVFKGGKLIGSFNLPSNSDKVVISFNSLSMPGAPKTMSITAFAVDPNTARTALASETDHHYLERYGALFASTFLEGFGNAFQSADTTIQVGGTGGTTNTTVQNGIGRSALENAVIGLANVGKSWGQVAQQNMARPTTVQIYSGTSVGVLFTQDLLAN